MVTYRQTDRQTDEHTPDLRITLTAMQTCKGLYTPLMSPTFANVVALCNIGNGIKYTFIGFETENFGIPKREKIARIIEIVKIAIFRQRK